MPLKRKPMRYAHPEGHTHVCYFTGEKRGLITCGSDGDVRSWLNLMDDDPAASCVSETAITVISKNGKIYVGNDNNTVQILNYPDLEKEGIITRFSAAVSALSTAKDSNLVASGACDMSIKVTDISTSDSIILDGHEAPILGLSLDPKEQYVASSSADGTIRVWNIKEKKVVHTWNNVVPKCNSFFTSKAYCVPSFHSKEGNTLAYPSNKDIVVTERSTWKELFRFKYPTLKAEFSICKYSECATRLAASSLYGEIVVWDVATKDLIGYIEHPQNAKITAIAWDLDKPDEIAFCDALGQLGCIEVIGNVQADDLESDGAKNGHMQDNVSVPRDRDDDDDDGENVISLDKLRAEANLEDDHSDTMSEKHEQKPVMPEVHVQGPFQPGSSPVHLLSRFMVWNDTGMVRCFTSEDGEESSIEVEFHDATVHRSLHINNYLRHTIAALSPEALALNCPSSEDTQSKVVAIALQGWGSGNKEWSIDLPEGEEGQCIAAGSNFIAVSTSRRNLRIYMIGGTQREIIALPGPVVAMNALENNLVVVYHNGIGASGDQHMNMFWIQIKGANLRSNTLSVPLSPATDLIWLGLTEYGSPVMMDSEDIVKVYDRKSSLWRVVSDMNTQSKGKADHYFIIGVSEEQTNIRCVLCKGSYYPPTTPRPVIIEIPLIAPLCQLEGDQTEKEGKLWKIGGQPADEEEIMLALIALACRGNAEYRVVDLCEQIASAKVLDFAIRYAARTNRLALIKKLESIAEDKDERNRIQETETDDNAFKDNWTKSMENVIEPISLSTVKSTTEVEIMPLPMTDSMKRSNPFLKNQNSQETKGLAGLSNAQEKPKIISAVKSVSVKPKAKNVPKKESFVSWYAKNKQNLQEEFPELSISDLAKAALARYKEETATPTTEGVSEGKKRKLSNSESEQNSQSKRSTTLLSSFAFNK